jgi:paraquat-inducible protein A
VALIATAILLYIPANVLPIMTTTQLGTAMDSTILGGVILLAHHGDYPIAAVIFIASVMVPISKLVALSWLCWSVSRGHVTSPHERARLYRATELVGKWSMTDVFVVAILVALIHLGGLLQITPGTAAVAFGGVVVVTMIAAHSFDPRLIWDQLGDARG